jgi:hypothetical protein
MGKKEKYDGRSRPTNETYSKRWEEIFGKKKQEEVDKENEEYIKEIESKL